MLPYWAIGNNELAELQDAPDEGTLRVAVRKSTLFSCLTASTMLDDFEVALLTGKKVRLKSSLDFSLN